jgi:hypothetical protein
VRCETAVTFQNVRGFKYDPLSREQMYPTNGWHASVTVSRFTIRAISDFGNISMYGHTFSP